MEELGNIEYKLSDTYAGLLAGYAFSTRELYPFAIAIQPDGNGDLIKKVQLVNIKTGMFSGEPKFTVAMLGTTPWYQVRDFRVGEWE